jgi:hypothetical protein
MKRSSNLLSSVNYVLVSVTVLFVLNTTPAVGQSKVTYAAQLMQERDYYRAISLYKELSFFSTAIDSQEYFGLQIAKAYRLSDKFELAAQTLSFLAKRIPLSEAGKRTWCAEMGMTQLLLDNKERSFDQFKVLYSTDSTGYAGIYVSLWHLRFTSIEYAKQYASYALRTKQTAREAEISSDYLQYLEKNGGAPSRSPLIASLLSAALPGAGQVYTGHYIDGLQAFTFTGIFLYSAILARQYDRDIAKNSTRSTIMFSIAGIFHLANIMGAERTAEYFNKKQADDLFNRGLRKVQALDY